VLLVACLLAPASARAADTWTIGLSTSGTGIEAVVVPGASPTAPTVVLIGGLDGPGSSDTIDGAVAAFERRPLRRRPFRLIAIARANPDAQPLQFPPTGAAYREQIESNVLWRWIGSHAPDLVLIAGADSGLADALSHNVVAGVGAVPARRVEPSATMLYTSAQPIRPSPAHQELAQRLARSPHVLAEQLTRLYGHDFTQPTYIAAMALIGRLRLGQQMDVEQLLAPYLDGTKDSFARPSQSALAAHMLFFELARRTGDERAKRLVIRAASSGFTESGELRESMPLNGGWSDSLFMDVPILAKAGALTGDRRYFDMAARHVAFMQRIVLRPDGLYRHQASTDAAWGRGNAFPALGLALTLSEFPKDHPAYAQLLASFQQHMATLARFQDENGMWRNIVDRPGAYAEYSATAMIGAAMVRGIRYGWLDRATYQPLVDKAWRAILARTSADGRLIDVCESTGTRGLDADGYLHRTALLGRDDRGGGMALLFATELETS
jgi:rhamnogalacturonyl hydrolase YesR